MGAVGSRGASEACFEDDVGSRRAGAFGLNTFLDLPILRLSKSQKEVQRMGLLT